MTKPAREEIDQGAQDEQHHRDGRPPAWSQDSDALQRLGGGKGIGIERGGHREVQRVITSRPRRSHHSHLQGDQGEAGRVLGGQDGGMDAQRVLAAVLGRVVEGESRALAEVRDARLQVHPILAGGREQRGEKHEENRG